DVLIWPPATAVVFPPPPNTDAKITRKSTGRARAKNCDWRLRGTAPRAQPDTCRGILITPAPSPSRGRQGTGRAPPRAGGGPRGAGGASPGPPARPRAAPG